MIRNMLTTVQERISGHQAKTYVADIAAYHRIQASPQFRRAAEYCRGRFEEFGVPAEVLGFPAREGLLYWGWPVFQEWEASEGVLHLIDPPEAKRKLADYNEARLSLFQRSASFEGEAEVVLLEDGEEWAEYEGLDLKGKVVLTRGDRDRVHRLAVEKHGAVGIISDALKEVPGVRRAMDLPDALQYSSFWWFGGETKCFGFVLSPREGARLRTLIEQRQREGKPPVRVQVTVQSRFFDGQIDIVSALIPGQTDEEVVLLAHLCHPQGAANDNASGSATVLEVARTLQGLIADGTLPQPRRGIRFLLVPEMFGLAAYLAQHEGSMPRMIASLNLDMVGEDLDLCGSLLTIEQGPASGANFADDLLLRLVEETSPSSAGPAGGARPGLATAPFSGGSDHCLLVDPTVGVPCPMINLWPDRFYHTSADTMEKVDPSQLARVGAMAATYAHFLANAGADEVPWLAEEVLSRHKARVLTVTRNSLNRATGRDQRGEGAVSLARSVRFLEERAVRALASLRRLADVDVSPWQREARQLAQDELASISALVPRSPDKPPTGKWEKEAASIVPRRLCPGPIDPKNFLDRMDDEEYEEWWRVYREDPDATYAYPPMLLYWADGQRNVQEISDLIELEVGKRVTELLVVCCRIWRRLGLVDL